MVDGNYTGDITVIGRDIQVLANGGHAQIGHGGFYARGDFRGNIFINYDPLANGGLGAVAGGSGALSIRAQGGGDHYAQVGHGGVVSVGNIRDGNIKVGDAASITLQAGWLRSATAQLGHGGVYSGTSTITGYIDITTQGNVSVLGGSGTASNGLAYSQIGHGGTSSGGSRTGDITIHSVSGTQFEVKGGTNTVAGTQGSYAQIGHGGDMYSGSAEGAITITASQASMELSGGREL
ncbi:MAG TPA: hypothetical protein PLA50_05675, partial [Bacteroidia bacterium]|nr:hypothetical protein [Bacteroidia bacterium]